MTQSSTKFFSCIDSRINQEGELYARFHIGSFGRGQAVTVANSLRRTLLSEIPGLGIGNIQIEGASHQFARLPGIKETVLDLILNLKGIVFGFADPSINTFTLQNLSFKGMLKIRGPGNVTAKDLKLPSYLVAINPNHHIATLSTKSELVINFEVLFCNPLKKFHAQPPLIPNTNNNFFLDVAPTPVKKVNYIIHEFDKKTGLEYITLEIWTNGSLTPKQTLIFALKKLTKLFYQFSQVNKNLFEK